MKTKLLLSILLLVTIHARSASAQLAEPPSALLISGDGFSFMVQEPPGWMGDTDSARPYGVSGIPRSSPAIWT